MSFVSPATTRIHAEHGLRAQPGPPRSRSWQGRLIRPVLAATSLQSRALSPENLQPKRSPSKVGLSSCSRTYSPQLAVKQNSLTAPVTSSCSGSPRADLRVIHPQHPVIFGPPRSPRSPSLSPSPVGDSRSTHGSSNQILQTDCPAQASPRVPAGSEGQSPISNPSPLSAKIRKGSSVLSCCASPHPVRSLLWGEPRSKSMAAPVGNGNHSTSHESKRALDVFKEMRRYSPAADASEKAALEFIPNSELQATVVDSNSDSCSESKTIDCETKELITTLGKRPCARPCFRKYARLAQAIVRLQFLVATPRLLESEVIGMLGRIRETLSTDRAFRIASNEVYQQFKQYKAEANGSLVAALPLAKIRSVLDYWSIPFDQIHLFWSTLRKLDIRLERHVLPDMIDFDTFSLVLLRFLKRVRNKHSNQCTADKDSFLRCNGRLFQDEYDEGGVIGSGSLGFCIWAENRQLKRLYVCKRVRMTRDDVGKDDIYTELELMRKLSHPHVLHVLEWFEMDGVYTLVLEPAHGGDVKGLLSRERDAGRFGLEENLVLQIVRQVLQALAYIHSENLIHRDVKPANMLLASALSMPCCADDLVRMHVLLADFGVAQLFGKTLDFVGSSSIESPLVSMVGKQSDELSYTGTLAYMSGEVFEGAPSTASDMWALGISTFEMLCAERPIRCENHMVFYSHLLEKDIDFDAVKEKGVSENALKLLETLLQKNSDLRPSAVDALELPLLGDCFEDAKDASSPARSCSVVSLEMKQAEESSSPPCTINLDEPLVNLFEKVGTGLSTQYRKVEMPDSLALPDFPALCDMHAKRLVEQHWLVTVRDLRDLDADAWVGLGLPLKLERTVKTLIGFVGESRK